MFFTDKKITTRRTATAQARITMSPQTMIRLRHKTIPKGDVLEVAKTAGILAAKKTPELIPYCHPLPLDGVEVRFELGEDHVIATSLVQTIWKTGVEMEALSAVSIAALTIYDMLKPIDDGLEIVQVKLTSKSGGKSDFKEKIPQHFMAAVIVTSDGTARGTREDKSGKIIVERLKNLGLEQINYVVLPDDKDTIRSELLKQIEKGCRLIVTTGGTGLGPRDVTVEATRDVIECEIPGVAEAMRSFGQARTPYAMLSRGLAGLKGNCVILNLPGSSRGTEECWDAIFPAIFHSYKMMAGGGHL